MAESSAAAVHIVEDAAKEALVYSYKNAASGFSVKLTLDQVSKISAQPGVLQVVATKTVQLHSGHQKPQPIMFGFMKSKNAGNQQGMTKDRRTSSEPVLPVDDDKYLKGKKKSSEELNSMSTQELETYAVNKASETTDSVYNSLRIAEEIRGTASDTLDTLHKQGEQIHRTHQMAADMDKDLAKGEKALGSLGGMFSMTWKPKKGKEIKGPVISKDDNTYVSNKNKKEQREKLGVAPKPKGKGGSRTPDPQSTSAMDQIEAEKSKQDDALDDLSGILGDLKGMAIDMGTEMDKQNKALDYLSDDVDELNSRVKGANQRTRKLLNK